MSPSKNYATIDDVTIEGTRLVVSAFGESRVLLTPAISPHLAAIFEGACEGASHLDEAVERFHERIGNFVPQRLAGEPRALAIVDSSAGPTGDDLVAWGRVLARLLSPQHSTIMVCGGVRVDRESDFDTLGSLAAALIRLRLGLFIGVGDRAKALATQVGLEGSWDGESVWADTPTRAYDYVCDQVRESDIVVVIGLDPDTTHALMSQWGEVAS